MKCPMPVAVAAPQARAVAGDVAARVSVVVPCRNEERPVEQLLEALRLQDWPIHDVIVVDDGSSDASAEVVEAYSRRYRDFPVRVVRSLQRGIPSAINVGIRSAEGDVVIRLDAHSYPAPDYVRRALEALYETDAGVIGGAWDIVPGRPGVIAQAIAGAVAHPLGAGDAAYRIAGRGTGRRTVDTVPFGCFRKALWEQVGGFNERLRTNEDYEFNYRVRQSGRDVVLDPRIRSTYFARGTLAELARQYFRYGWWKAEMLKSHPRSLRWRQAVPATFVAGCATLAAASPFLRPAAWSLVALLAVYAVALIGASVHISGGRRSWRILPALPVAFAVIHFSWGGGLLVNLLTAGRWPRRAAAIADAPDAQRQRASNDAGRQG